MGVDPNTGKKRYYSEAVRGTKPQSERRLTELQRQLDIGSFVESSQLTVGGYLEEWLLQSAKGRVSDRTLAGYRGNVQRYLLPKLGTIVLDKLAPRHIQKMESELLQYGEKLASRSLRQRCCTFTVSFSSC